MSGRYPYLCRPEMHSWLSMVGYGTFVWYRLLRRKKMGMVIIWTQCKDLTWGYSQCCMQFLSGSNIPYGMYKLWKILLCLELPGNRCLMIMLSLNINIICVGLVQILYYKFMLLWSMHTIYVDSQLSFPSLLSHIWSVVAVYDTRIRISFSWISGYDWKKCTSIVFWDFAIWTMSYCGISYLNKSVKWNQAYLWIEVWNDCIWSGKHYIYSLLAIMGTF